MSRFPLIPHVEQYMGPSCMYEPVLRELVDRVNHWNLADHVDRVQAGDEDGPERGGTYEVTRDGIAVFAIEGPITKYGSSLSNGAGTVDLRRGVRKAAKDTTVSAIMLRIDSPGGMYAGTGDLAADIRAASKSKPVHAYIEDMGASGAYWLASQAHRISANPGALVGSIGTYRVVIDTSAAADKAGFKVRVVGAGEFKGAGEPGTPITDPQMDDFRREVNEINAVFLAAVQEPRGFTDEQMAEVATGQVWEASEAKKRRLVDNVQTFDEAMGELSTRAGNVTGNKDTNAMTTKNDKWNRYRVAEDDDREDKMEDEEEREDEAEQDEEEESKSEEDEREEESKAQGDEDEDKSARPATLTQLKRYFPKSTAEDREHMMIKGMTLAQAGRHMTDVLSARLENREEELQAAKKRPGNKALGNKAKTKAEAPDNPRSEWNRLIKEKCDGGMNRQQATVSVARENPELREALVAAAN